jgi:hypothetical protein
MRTIRHTSFPAPAFFVALIQACRRIFRVQRTPREKFFQRSFSDETVQ